MEKSPIHMVNGEKKLTMNIVIPFIKYFQKHRKAHTLLMGVYVFNHFIAPSLKMLKLPTLLDSAPLDLRLCSRETPAHCLRKLRPRMFTV